MLTHLKPSPFKIFVICSSLFILPACNDSESTVDNSVQQGTFIDSAVAGLNYQCGESSGITDLEGHFNYQLLDICTFSIGELVLGSTESMSEANQVLSPFDITGSEEEAIKIAALLQSLDNDGNADNGLDITGGDFSSLDTGILSKEGEAFSQSIFEVTGRDAISLEDARIHMEASLRNEKGYYSKAVEEAVSQINSVNDIEQIDLQNFIANLHAILDAGDDSNNNDIKSLKALISIYEILNHPLVQERMEVSGGSDNYTELLPQVMMSSVNTSELVMKGPRGTTEDISEILFEMSTRLVLASDALGESFMDVNYVASYGASFSLTAEDAYNTQKIALITANILSYFSAYNYASDDYYFTQSFNQNVTVIESSYDTFALGTPQGEISKTTKVLETVTDFTTADIRPDYLYLDDNLGRLHTDEKYLSLAKASLIKVIEVEKKLITSIYDDLNDVDVEKESEVLDQVLTNLSAADDGISSALTIDYDNLHGKLNLQALYSPETAIDRDDFNISASIDCGEFEYSESYSKLMNKPMCTLGDYNDQLLDSSNSTILSNSFEGGIETLVRIYAIPAQVDFAIEPSSNTFLERFLINCHIINNDDSSQEACLNLE